jgi:hypothetical protein
MMIVQAFAAQVSLGGLDDRCGIRRHDPKPAAAAYAHLNHPELLERP